MPNRISNFLRAVNPSLQNSPFGTTTDPRRAHGEFTLAEYVVMHHNFDFDSRLRIFCFLKSMSIFLEASSAK